MNPSELDFSGKTVLVVGGSSGIGNAIAQAFRAKGAAVHVWGTRPTAADYADNADSDLAGLHYRQVDVSDTAALANIDAGIHDLDVLVLSQGLVLYGRAEFEQTGFDRVLQVNLNSLMACCMRFHAQLKASAGAVVVISSTAAFHATRGNPAYGASKAGALGLTRTLADAWASEGIRVNGIAPGMVPTKMTKVTTDSPKRLEAVCAQIPLGRLGRAQEIAAVALFLASPMASYVIGQTLAVDGGLFQAICRTNRLDGDDKDYGHIVDFKELFGDVQKAIAVCNSDELDIDEGGGADGNVHLKDWLAEGRKQLEQAREALRHLCEPVALPREVEQYLRYFCGDAANPNALNDTEALRVSLYKAVATFGRAFAAVAHNLTEAGYSEAQASAVQGEVALYSDIRSAIKKHSGEELDIKPCEADMRHLLNSYIQADAAADLGALGEMSLTELIIETGIHDAIAKKLNEKGKLSKNAIAEGIINNVRKTIIRDQLTDPRFYAQMSKLLDDLIQQSRDDTAVYEELLRRTEALVRRLAGRQPDQGVPAVLHGKREAAVLYNNLDSIPATTFKYPTHEDDKAALALRIDQVVREQAPAGWFGDHAREAQVLNALFPLLDRDRQATQAVFDIVKNQPGYQ